MAYPATPKSWVAGDVLTAAQLNAEVRDALLGAFPLGAPDVAWTGYTPTLTQSGAVTKTVTYAKYTRVGRLITVQVSLSVTGTGTASNNITVALPVTAAQANLIIGSGFVYDASAGLMYKAIVESFTATTVAFHPTNTTANDTLGTAVMTAALASGDLVNFCATYEAAT